MATTTADAAGAGQPIVDPNTVAHIMIFGAVVVGLMLVAGTGDMAYKIVLGFLVVAMIYALLQPHGTSAIAWVDGLIKSVGG